MIRMTPSVVLFILIAVPCHLGAALPASVTFGGHNVTDVTRRQNIETEDEFESFTAHTRSDIDSVEGDYDDNAISDDVDVGLDADEDSFEDGKEDDSAEETGEKSVAFENKGDYDDYEADQDSAEDSEGFDEAQDEDALINMKSVNDYADDDDEEDEESEEGGVTDRDSDVEAPKEFVKQVSAPQKSEKEVESAASRHNVASNIEAEIGPSPTSQTLLGSLASPFTNNTRRDSISAFVGKVDPVHSVYGKGTMSINVNRRDEIYDEDDDESLDGELTLADDPKASFDYTANEDASASEQADSEEQTCGPEEAAYDQALKDNGYDRRSTMRRPKRRVRNLNRKRLMPITLRTSPPRRPPPVAPGGASAMQSTTTMKGKVLWSKVLMNWNWQSYSPGLKFRSVPGKVYTHFLVDGTFSEHMSFMQRFVFNLAEILDLDVARIGFSSFASVTTTIQRFAAFGSDLDLQRAILRLKPISSEGRKTGEALIRVAQYYKSLPSNAKKLLFVLIKGRTYGCFYKLKSAAALLRSLGVRVYVIGFGSQCILEELTTITTSSRVFRATLYPHIVVGNNQKPGIIVRIQNRLERWLKDQVGVWYLDAWNWYKYIKGLKYGVIGSTNVGFLLDTTNKDSVSFLSKYAFNIARLFQFQGTNIAAMAYGATQSLITGWRQFTSPTDLQVVFNLMPNKKGPRKTGQALNEMLKLFLPKTQGKVTTSNYLFVFTTGKPEDTELLKIVGKLYRERSIKVIAFGISTTAYKYKFELALFAFNPTYIIYGDKQSMITIKRFEAIISILKVDSGSGGAIIEEKGDNVLLEIQKYWNWGDLYDPLNYGKIAKANVGIVIEGFFVRNFDYIKRLVYNLIRIHHLGGTYFNIIVYGRNQYRVINWQQIRDGKAARLICNNIRKVKVPSRRTGSAIGLMLDSFEDAAPSKVNIMYVITKGKSQDDVVQPSVLVRRAGIKLISIGLSGFNPRFNIGSKGASIKEISIMAYSSGFIFSSTMNGLVKLVVRVQTFLESMIGTPSTAFTPSGSIDVDNSNIVLEWDWRVYGYQNFHQSVKPSTVVFLVDGTNQNHFDVIQKFVYNVGRLFLSTSNIAIVTYGGDVDMRLAVFKQYPNAITYQIVSTAIRYSGSKGSRLGYALTQVDKLFKRAPDRSAKKVLFILTTTQSSDRFDNAASVMQGDGVSIFSFSIGVPVTGLPSKSLIRLTVRWRDLVKVVVNLETILFRVIGKQPREPDTGVITYQTENINKIIIDYYISPLIYPGFVSPISAKTITLLQTVWNWERIQKGIIYDGLGAADVIFVVDVTKDDNFPVIQKLVYNLIRLFRRPTLTVTLIVYGRAPRAIVLQRKINGILQLKFLVAYLKPKTDKIANLGRALKFLNAYILPRFQKQRPIITFVISQRSSSDNVREVTEQIKGKGVTVVSVGIGDVNQDEILSLGSTGYLSYPVVFPVLPAVVVRAQYFLYIIINGLPKPEEVRPIDIYREIFVIVRETIAVCSIPHEQSGRPDAGKPGGPKKPNTGEGNQGGASGKPPNCAGGTDVISGGGSEGTGIKPVFPKIKISITIIKPSPHSGGQGAGPNSLESLKVQVVKKIQQCVVNELKSLGERQRLLGGEKVSKNIGLSPSGGIINPLSKGAGTSLGAVIPAVSVNAVYDESSPKVEGGAQVLEMYPAMAQKIATAWNWEKIASSYSYDALKPSSVVFVIDASNPSTIETIKRYAFNIGRMFVMKNTKFTVISVGSRKAAARIYGMNKRYNCPTSLKDLLDSVKPETGRPTLSTAYKAVTSVLKKARGRTPSAVFTLLQSKLANSPALLKKIGNGIRKRKAVFHVFGLGKRYDSKQVAQLIGDNDDYCHEQTVENTPLTLSSLEMSLIRDIGPGSKIGVHLCRQSRICRERKQEGNGKPDIVTKVVRKRKPKVKVLNIGRPSIVIKRRPRRPRGRKGRRGRRPRRRRPRRRRPNRRPLGRLRKKVGKKPKGKLPILGYVPDFLKKKKPPMLPTKLPAKMTNRRPLGKPKILNYVPDFLRKGPKGQSPKGKRPPIAFVPSVLKKKFPKGAKRPAPKGKPKVLGYVPDFLKTTTKITPRLSKPKVIRRPGRKPRRRRPVRRKPIRTRKPKILGLPGRRPPQRGPARPRRRKPRRRRPVGRRPRRKRPVRRKPRRRRPVRRKPIRTRKPKILVLPGRKQPPRGPASPRRRKPRRRRPVRRKPIRTRKPKILGLPGRRPPQRGPARPRRRKPRRRRPVGRMPRRKGPVGRRPRRRRPVRRKPRRKRPIRKLPLKIPRLSKGPSRKKKRIPSLPNKAKGLIMKVQITAAGCNDAPNRGKACNTKKGSIKVNGREFSPNKRGLNVAFFDFPSGRFRLAANFDTFASKDNSDKLARFIAKIPDNKIVMVASKDEYTSKLTPAGYSALASIGGKEPFVNKFRGSYALLGFKGKNRPGWTAQKQSEPRRGPSNIFAQLMFRPIIEKCLSPRAEVGTNVCNNKKKKFRCPAGKSIAITFASYGRSSREVCKSPFIKTTNCASKTALEKVKRFCNGKPKCSLMATTRIFGDPCRGTNKYLTVRYTCVPIPSDPIAPMPVPKPSPRPAVKVEIHSEGSKDKPIPPGRRCKARRVSVKINGIERLNGKPGANFVLLNRFGRYIGTSSDLSRYPDGTIVIVATLCRWNIPAAVWRMISVGPTNRRAILPSSSMAIIGIKGRASFSWLKRVNKMNGQGPLDYSAQIPVPVPPLRRLVKPVAAIQLPRIPKRLKGPGPSKGVKIELVATGCNDPGIRGKCAKTSSSIKLNGVNVSPNGRGLNLVAFRGTKIIKKLNADTYADTTAGLKVKRFIDRVPRGATIAVCSKDEYTKNLNKPAIAALKSIGARGNLKGGFRASIAICGVKGSRQFGRQVISRPGRGPSKFSMRMSSSPKRVISRKYIKSRKVLIRKMAKTRVKGATKIARVKVKKRVTSIAVISEGCNDKKFKVCNQARGSIRINGREVSVNRRGLNVVQYNPINGRVNGRANFDTFTSAAASNALAKYIRRVPSGRIVVVAAKDEYTRKLTGAAKQALKSIGGKDASNNYRGSYALIGSKGFHGMSKQVKKPAGQGPSLIKFNLNFGGSSAKAATRSAAPKAEESVDDQNVPSDNAQSAGDNYDPSQDEDGPPDYTSDEDPYNERDGDVEGDEDDGADEDADEDEYEADEDDTEEDEDEDEDTDADTETATEKGDKESDKDEDDDEDEGEEEEEEEEKDDDDKGEEDDSEEKKSDEDDQDSADSKDSKTEEGDEDAKEKEGENAASGEDESGSSATGSDASGAEDKEKQGESETNEAAEDNKDKNNDSSNEDSSDQKDDENKQGAKRSPDASNDFTKADDEMIDFSEYDESKATKEDDDEDEGEDDEDDEDDDASDDASDENDDGGDSDDTDAADESEEGDESDEEQSEEEDDGDNVRDQNVGEEENAPASTDSGDEPNKAVDDVAGKRSLHNTTSSFDEESPKDEESDEEADEDDDDDESYENEYYIGDDDEESEGDSRQSDFEGAEEEEQEEGKDKEAADESAKGRAEIGNRKEEKSKESEQESAEEDIDEKADRAYAEIENDEGAKAVNAELKKAILKEEERGDAVNDEEYSDDAADDDDDDDDESDEDEDDEDDESDDDDEEVESEESAGIDDSDQYDNPFFTSSLCNVVD